MQAQPATKTELYVRQTARRVATQTANLDQPLRAEQSEPDYIDTDIPPAWRVGDADNRERLKRYMRRLSTALNSEAVVRPYN